MSPSFALAIICRNKTAQSVKLLKLKNKTQDLYSNVQCTFLVKIYIVKLVLKKGIEVMISVSVLVLKIFE